MEGFNDWYFELFESGNGSSLNQQEIAEEAWDFRQAEVDELRKRIDDLDKQLFVQKGLNRFLKGKSNDN